MSIIDYTKLPRLYVREYIFKVAESFDVQSVRTINLSNLATSLPANYSANIVASEIPLDTVGPTTTLWPIDAINDPVNMFNNSSSMISHENYTIIFGQTTTSFSAIIVLKYDKLTNAPNVSINYPVCKFSGNNRAIMTKITSSSFTTTNFNLTVDKVGLQELIIQVVVIGYRIVE